jgi:hypothetical protein
MTMAPRRKPGKVAQAWIELISQDPEALSALEVARTQLKAGKHLKSLRRIRLIELCGKLPARDRVEKLLHGSTQFYNPHKERCSLRLSEGEPPPWPAGEHAVLVYERGATRLAAAERWWRHETGEMVEVREGTTWVMSFDDPAVGEEEAQDLALVRGRRHGLLCNPHSQEHRVAGEAVPLPWLDEDGSSEGAKPTRERPAAPTRSKK